jgi:hypothetical protein
MPSHRAVRLFNHASEQASFLLDEASELGIRHLEDDLEIFRKRTRNVVLDERRLLPVEPIWVTRCRYVVLAAFRDNACNSPSVQQRNRSIIGQQLTLDIKKVGYRNV